MVKRLHVVVMKRVWQRVKSLMLCPFSYFSCCVSHPSQSQFHYHRLKSNESPPSPPAQYQSESESLHADDTLFVKISMLGDTHTGKTSLMAKYVRSEGNEEYIQTRGVSCMRKVLGVRGVKIAFSIWDIGGHLQFTDVVPRSCEDAAAIFIMFDLTSRSTLNSVTEWYHQARRFNQHAILVLIGTKFDHFIHLPLDIQLTIVTQARVYAHAMGAILFFSSITHNINVQKIFKVVTAKLFDMPCNIARNLTIGEPIIEY